jgi:hypothetical protein
MHRIFTYSVESLNERVVDSDDLSLTVLDARIWLVFVQTERMVDREHTRYGRPVSLVSTTSSLLPSKKQLRIDKYLQYDRYGRNR